MYKDAPTVRNQKPTFHERKPHSNASTHMWKRAPSNTCLWTSSQTCRRARSTTVSSRSLIKDAPKQQNSYHATKQLMDKESRDSTLPTLFHSLDYQRESFPP